MITGIDLFEFSVRDKARIIAFYRDVLGLKATDEDEHGAEFTLADGTTLGIWQPDSDDYPLGAGIMFAVADIKHAIEYYRARGVELGKIMETRVCYMAHARDPEGNRFVLHQRKNTA